MGMKCAVKIVFSNIIKFFGFRICNRNVFTFAARNNELQNEQKKKYRLKQKYGRPVEIENIILVNIFLLLVFFFFWFYLYFKKNCSAFLHSRYPS